VTTEPGHTGRAHAAMTHRERVEAALRGLPVDRPAISLWRHFPGQDDTGQRLADATIQFQNQYDVDLIKLMPTGMYCVVDYGVEIALADDDVGSTHFVSGPIREPADWGRLPDVSPTRGFLREQVEAVKILRCRLGADTPIIQTIFSPGADGFFFATQLATRSALPTGVYERLGIPYDRKVLDALRSGSWCTVLHLHGLDPMFDLADVYPVDAVNWHDRETTPSLTEALQRTRRALVAGIARRGVIAQEKPEAAAAEVRDAIAQTEGRRIVVAPGCVIPTTAPAESMLAARRAVE
jgi:uroporphyrinogen decarboxylase